MLGNRLGFAGLLKKEIPTLKVTHCMIHMHVFSLISMLESMKDVFDTCIKMVNVIRKHDTNHRIFQSFCDETSDEHYILLYHPCTVAFSRPSNDTLFRTSRNIQIVFAIPKL